MSLTPDDEKKIREIVKQAVSDGMKPSVDSLPIHKEPPKHWTLEGWILKKIGKYKWVIVLLAISKAGEILHGIIVVQETAYNAFEQGKLLVPKTQEVAVQVVDYYNKHPFLKFFPPAKPEDTDKFIAFQDGVEPARYPSSFSNGTIGFPAGTSFVPLTGFYSITGSQDFNVYNGTGTIPPSGNV